MQRRSLLRWTAGVFVVLASGSIRAATPDGRAKRLGVLILDGPQIWTEFPPALRVELSALGWVEGKT